jgi:hypothetical protein
MTYGPKANFELIAPCGKGCSVCLFYLAFINDKVQQWKAKR